MNICTCATQNDISRNHLISRQHKKLIKGKLLTQNLFIHRAPFLQQHIYIIEPKCHPCHLGLHVLTQLSINNVKKVPKRLKSKLVHQLPIAFDDASGLGNLATWKGVIPIGKTGASLRFLPPCHTQFGAIDRRSRLVREVPGLLVPGLLPQLSLSLSLSRLRDRQFMEFTDTSPGFNICRKINFLVYEYNLRN